MPLIGDGVANDLAALQALTDATSAHDTLTLPPDSTFRLCVDYATPERGLSLKEGVTLDLNGSRINFEFDNAVYGVRPRSGSAIRNGRVAVMSSTNLASAQGIYHAAIALGCAYGEVLNVNNLGPYICAEDWTIRDVELSTVKPGGLHISGVGGIHDGKICDVKILDSANAFGAINFDWGTIGSPGTIPQNRASWPASFYTVHPTCISIERPKIGALTAANAEAIRLSGCSAIDIRSPHVKFASQSGFSHYGGDFGFEFCSPALPRWRSFQNTAVRGLTVDGVAAAGSVFRLDALADNVAREPGYVPLTQPTYASNILIDGVFGLGGPNGVGMRIGPIAGGVIQRVRFMGFHVGADFAAGITRLQWRDSVVHGGDASALPYTGSTAGVTMSNVVFES